MSRFPLALLASFLAFVRLSPAGTIYDWTATPTATANPTGGTGTWNLTSPNWYSSGIFSVQWGNGTADSAIFGATAGTVTLGVDGIQANSLTFNTNGYTLAGGGHTLTLSGTSPTISAGLGISANISAPLSSSQTIGFLGAGTVNLTGGGTLSGITTSATTVGIGGGTLNLNSSSAPFTVSGSGTLSLSNGAIVNALGTTEQVDGTLAKITVDGSGTQLNTGFQTLVGNAANGSLTVQNHGQLNAGTFLLMGTNNDSSGTLTVQSGGTVTSPSGILGFLAGSTGAATVSGTGSAWNNGTLDLGGLTGSGAGGAGTLTVGSGGAVSATGATTLWTSGSSITINGGTLTTATLASNGAVGSINLQADPAGQQALSINGGGGTGTYAGSISGAGGIFKTGASVETLSGTNTFTGSTIINGGSIVVGSATALQNSTVALGVNNGLNLNGLTAATIGGLSGSGALNLGTTSLSVGGNNQSTSYAGPLSATSGAITKQGTGTLTLSGGGSIDSLTVGQGTLAVTGGTLNLTDAGLGLNVGGAASLTLSGGAVVNVTGASLVDNSASITVSGAGTQLNTGSEILVAQGASASLTVQNQGLMTGNVAAIGFATGSNGNLLIQSGGVVTFNGSGVGVLAGATGAATVTGAGSAWNNGSLGIGGFGGGQNGGTGALTIANGGAVNTSGPTTIWTNGSSIIINGGTLTTGTLASSGGVGSINLQADPTGGHALTINGQFVSNTFAGTISGSGSLVMGGLGSTQTLNGANTYTGTSLVTAGTLVQSGGSNKSTITAANGGAFVANGGTTLSPLNGFGAITAQAGGTVEYDNATLNGGFLSGSGTQLIAAGGATFNGTTVNLGTTVTQNGVATFNDVTLNGHVVNGATLAWTGGSIGSGGVLDVDNTVNASGLTSNGQIDIAPGATLAVSGTDLALGNGSRTFVGSVGSPGGSITLTGCVLDLDGGLLVNNGTISGTVDINFGGLAEGAGTYGAVNISNGGEFHPGNSPGTVTSSSATWGAGGELEFDIDDATGTAGVNWSLWDITGALDITAGNTLNSRFKILLDSLLANDTAGPAADFDATHAYAWNFVNAGSISGFNSANFTIDTSGFANALNGGSFSLVSDGQNLTLDFTPNVPEPSTAVLGLAALGLVWEARRRARRRA